MKSKESDTDGTHYIIVNAAAIEVDRVTFSRLMVGDNVRVRYTRDAKAIAIDRTVIDVGHEGSQVSPK